MASEKIARLFWTAAFFGWAALLLITSLVPTTGLEPKSGGESTFRWDYPFHFIVFLILALLFAWWWKSNKAGNSRGAISWFLAGGTVYAMLTEGIQLFVEGRSFNPVDLFYNVLGVLIGTILAFIFIIRPKQKYSLKK